MKKVVKNNKKGFTLIEIIVVVAMLCILVGAVYAGVSGSKKKADDASAKLKKEADDIGAFADSQEAEMGALGF